MLRVFESFRGYGSQTLALSKYGVKFKNVGGCEIDKYADIAHEALHDPVKNYGDIIRINALAIPDMDLFTYSFPCQDISMAGKQRGFIEGSGTRSSLLWECQKIIELKRPKYLMMENVKALLSKALKSKIVGTEIKDIFNNDTDEYELTEVNIYEKILGSSNFDKFNEFLKILEGLGYNNYYKVINAKHCGIPQNRERVFCVSILKEHDNFNFHFYDDFDSGIRLKDILEKEVDEKYYMSGEKTRHLIKNLEAQGYEGYEGYKRNYECEGNSYCLDANYNKGTSVSSIGKSRRTQIVERTNKLDMIGMLNIKGNESIRRVYEPEGVSPALTTMQGGNRQPKIVEACAIRGRNPKNPKSRESGLPTQQMLEVSKNPEVSNCLTTVQKDSVILEKPNFRIRKLTPRECFRLMGLSESDIDKIQVAGISNSQQYKMAGNSIPLACMKFLKQLR